MGKDLKRHKAAEPKRETAAGWVARTRKEHGKEKLPRGYTSRIVE
jgi:hypothetical protein